MKTDKAHFIAFVGVMSALMFVLFLLEGALSITVGISTCVLSLPVAIALSIYGDWKKSFIGGTLLGVCSCIFCLIFGMAVYANPLISILPRFFIGVTAYWGYFGFSKLFRKAKHRYFRETLPASLGALAGTVTNSVLYILALNLFAGGNLMGAFTQLLQVAVAIYFPVELAASFILVPLYVMALKKVSGRFVEKKNDNKVAPQKDAPRDVNTEV